MEWDPVWRILAAAAMAAPIGLDREINGKPAGLRTHLLLATATAALGFLSRDVAQGDPSADPTRIASYVVAGIGFIGAGLIVGIRGRVYGLTTAVAAFSVMAIGVLNGMGYPTVALALTVVSLLALWPMDWLKDRTYGRVSQVETTLHVTVTDPARLSEILEMIVDLQVDLRGVMWESAGPVVIVQATVRARGTTLDALREAVADHPATAGPPVMAGAGSLD